jgi:transposase
MSVNSLRGHLSEFGIVVAKGIGRVDELLELAENDTINQYISRSTFRRHI